MQEIGPHIGHDLLLLYEFLTISVVLVLGNSQLLHDIVMLL